MSVEDDIKVLKKSLRNLKKMYSITKINYSRAVEEIHRLEKAGASEEDLEKARNEANFHHEKKQNARNIYNEGKHKLDTLKGDDDGPPDEMPEFESRMQSVKMEALPSEEESMEEPPAMDEGFMTSMVGAATALTTFLGTTDDAQDKKKKKKKKKPEDASMNEPPAMDEGFMTSMVGAATAFLGATDEAQDEKKKKKKKNKKQQASTDSDKKKLLKTYESFYNYSLEMKQKQQESSHQWKQIIIKLLLEAENLYHDCEDDSNGKKLKSKESPFDKFVIHLRLCKTVSELEQITNLRQNDEKQDTTDDILQSFKALDEHTHLSVPFTVVFDIDITKPIDENYKNLKKQFMNGIGLVKATKMNHLNFFDKMVNQDENHLVIKTYNYLLDEAKAMITGFQDVNNIEESLGDPFAFMLFTLMKKLLKLERTMKKNTLYKQQMHDRIEKYKIHFELLQCVSHMEIYAKAAKTYDRGNANLEHIFTHYNNIQTHDMNLKFKFEYIFDVDISAKDNCIRLEKLFTFEEQKYKEDDNMNNLSEKDVTENLNESKAEEDDNMSNMSE